VSRQQLIQEITPPFPCRYFAYPYGAYNNEVVQAVKNAGYERAWSVRQGTLDTSVPDWQFKIYRDYVAWFE
jgi:peptidoglycan/xylan/chitin deacetylase (PgdA/CDA1 family)